MAAAVCALALAVGAAGCASDDATSPTETVEEALLERLEDKSLSVTWVTCVEGPVQTGPNTVYRCNVNFGDPHIEGYCAVLRDGDLLTHIEEPSLRCARERTSEGQPIG